eukprot:15437777-Alexandrium_andersonii.AAC.1
MRRPVVSGLRARGAALRAAPPVPGTANEGVADFRRFRARDNDVSPCGPAGSRGLFRMEFRPLLKFSD